MGENRPGLGRKRASRAASDSDPGVDTAGSQQSRPFRSFNSLRLSWLAEAIVDRSLPKLTIINRFRSK